MPSYDKLKIQNCCDKYIETNDPDDFGELLMALEPMVRKIVKRWWSLRNYHDDMVQEILMTIWKKFNSINRLKLIRMKTDQSGDRICLANYYYFVIRGYLKNVGSRFEHIFADGRSYTAWFMMEEWMGHVEDVEGYKKHDEGKNYMEKLLEIE